MARSFLYLALGCMAAAHAADVPPRAPNIAIGSVGTGSGAPAIGSGLPGSAIGTVGGPLERPPLGSVGSAQPPAGNPVSGICTSLPSDLRRCDGLDDPRREAGVSSEPGSALRTNP